ncbi:TonB-dependent receptor domain-containing protein [Sphingosinicella rhizophila]|uniref:TonB-dependent receptor n=1 Tax=Sphingosinicella rhizophila TaxID=3050082 RepID=A0ABU3QC65_9SPHN|nr:TonB-dependent receptor [Sphingosinicella sp. GR2756]MDT9600990.1 TonB-dependent receptor [Sphingosinicella sp. GR2756]
MAVAAPAPLLAQQQTYAFDIPAQDLGSALRNFAQVSRQQVTFSGALVRGKRGNAVSGTYTAPQALDRLLAGTGLSVRRAVRGVLVLQRTAPAAQEGSTASPDARTTSALGEQALQAREAETGDISVKGETDEIVVTAQKREERLQDVPVPVTALSADRLVESNRRRLEDYYTAVPGLNFSMDNRGSPSMAIRGITTGAYVTPTVGFTIDDVPYGSSVVVSSFSPAPDADPNELSRIEILRGPQGTLYGASSLGGLIKYVTKAPELLETNGRIQAGLSSTSYGDEPGYSVSGAINLPIGSALAVRASGFVNSDAGYVDNVTTGEEDVNRTNVVGGRVAALWEPFSRFSLKLGALFQRRNSDGSSQVNLLPSLDRFQHAYLGGLGGHDRKVYSFTAHANAELGRLDLASITGYTVGESEDSYDVSAALGGLTGALFGVSGVAFAEDNKTRNFSQEIRATAPIGSRLELLAGVFYTHQRTDANGGFVLVDPVSYDRVSQALDQRIDQEYSEAALFADLTIEISDRFDVQIGGRWSSNEQSYQISSFGPLVPIFLGAPSPVIAPEVESQDESFTYLFTPRFRVTSDLMVYARLASGYRPGGPNPNQSAAIPATFGPDKTRNYEIGLKGEFLDRSLSVDASVYYVDWRDIQISLLDQATFLTYTANASRGRSQGIEFSIEARPIRGMTASLWGVYNDSELTRPLPANSSAFADAGDRLPYSSRYSAAASLEQRFPMFDGTGLISGSVAYVGKREGEFTGGARQLYPSYTKIDFKAGFEIKSWSLNMFVNNLTNSKGVLGGGLGTFPAFSFNYIRPRTAGINITRTF